MEQLRVVRLRLIMVQLFCLAILNAVAQIAPAERRSGDHPSPTESMHDLSHLADEAHQSGDVSKEIGYRKDLSRLAWDNFARNPKSPGMWNRWGIVYWNDLPLALLLEGTHQWAEAETVFRHNQFNLAHERLAGNDVKSENQLHLARLLTKEGRQPEARAICSHWKDRVKHNADFALFAVKHNVPTPPLYDTPEVEIAEWKLTCGLPEEGLGLLSQQIQAHPGMLAPYMVLRNYDLAEGDFQEARAAERDGTTALLGR